MVMVSSGYVSAKRKGEKEMKKYKIIEDEFIDFYGRKLYRIIRIVDNVKGGFIESINNLSQEDNAWVSAMRKFTASKL